MRCRDAKVWLTAQRDNDLAQSEISTLQEQQLVNIRAQQQTRIASLRIFTPRFAAIAYLIIGLVSLSLLALFFFQTDLVVKALALLSDGIDALVLFVQYLQMGLALITHDTWLLSGMALTLVILMGMWLRLMRYPQEA